MNDRAIKPYDQVKKMLGKASGAWERLAGYIVFTMLWMNCGRKGTQTISTIVTYALGVAAKRWLRFAFAKATL